MIWRTTVIDADASGAQIGPARSAGTSIEGVRQQHEALPGLELGGGSMR